MKIEDNNNSSAVVYGLIRDGDYEDAISYLNIKLLKQPLSRAALSLLGYCYYNLHEHERAAEIYHKLIRLYPNQYDYYINQSQTLLLLGKLEEAEETIKKIPQARRDEHVKILLAKVKFEKGELSESKALLRSMNQSHEVLLIHAAILCKEGRFEEGLQKYNQCNSYMSLRPGVAYSKAFCHYRMNQSETALSILNEIISRAGTQEETDDTLHDSCDCVVEKTEKSSPFESFLVEAVNLKMAIEYNSGQLREATKTWKKMPIRGDEDVDAVSLHNQAIIHMGSDKDGGFEKLTFLLRSHPPFPLETLFNLLILYCKDGLLDAAADIMSENESYLQVSLSPNLYQFFTAIVVAKSSIEQSSHQLEEVAATIAYNMQKWKKRIHDFKRRGNNESALRNAMNTLQDERDLLVPIVMMQSKMYWDRFDYENSARILHSVAEYCHDNNEWKLNMAHALFMQQGDKYNDAISFYMAVINSQGKECLLHVSPIAIANLCVSLIMVKRNEEAESLLKRLQSQEEYVEHTDEQESACHHSCIVNLVIGTLYCERGNFEFGIERICKSLQPYEDKLGADTWYYAKLCLLALVDKITKQMYVLTDKLKYLIHRFLDDLYDHGLNIAACMNNVLQEESERNRTTISEEVRRLKWIFLQL